MFDSLANSESQGVPVEHAYHIGKVVINDDPEMMQRIKVTVPGYLDNENTDTLPWIGPVHTSEFGMNESYGVVRVPCVGSLVVVKFQNGDVQHGMYVGYVPTRSFARNMPAQLKTNYPNRVGYIDPMGTVVFTDVATGEMTINHFTGSVFRIEASGPMLTIISDIDITGNIHLKGNITMEGDTTQTGNVTLTGNQAITGNQTVTGNVVITGTETVAGVVTAGSVVSLGPIGGPSGTIGGVNIETHTHTDSRGGSTSPPNV